MKTRGFTPDMTENQARAVEDHNALVRRLERAQVSAMVELYKSQRRSDRRLVATAGICLVIIILVALKLSL